MIDAYLAMLILLRLHPSYRQSRQKTLATLTIADLDWKYCIYITDLYQCFVKRNSGAAFMSERSGEAMPVQGPAQGRSAL
jgi:hypothetical protein